MFDPQPGVKYDKDDDHMAQVMELLGEMPKSLALSGKYSQEMFTRRGELAFRFPPLIPYSSLYTHSASPRSIPTCLRELVLIL